jgi:peroxiredoxin
LAVPIRDRLLLGAIAVSAILFSAMQSSVKELLDPSAVSRFATAMATPSKWQGKLAPDFEVSLLNGESFKLADHVGRDVIVLNFFATWCGPCREEVPELTRFYDDMHGKPVVILGIDAAEDREKVEALVRQLKIDYPVAIDRDVVQKAYGVLSFPKTVVIGPDGRIALYEEGGISNANVSLQPVVDEALAAIKSGRGIARDDFLRQIAEQKKSEDIPQSSSESGLTGRAQRIAAAMTCPCGCEHTVAECACNTAKRIKERLKGADFGERADAEIIRELNREFCEKES